MKRKKIKKSDIQTDVLCRKLQGVILIRTCIATVLFFKLSNTAFFPCYTPSSKGEERRGGLKGFETVMPRILPTAFR